MATRSTHELRDRAERIAVLAANAALEVEPLASVPGGGTLPGVEIPSVGVGLDGDHSAALRRAEPPIIARVHDGRTLLDLRTVDPTDDDHVIAALLAFGNAAQAPAGAAPPTTPESAKPEPPQETLRRRQPEQPPPITPESAKPEPPQETLRRRQPEQPPPITPESAKPEPPQAVPES